ncbi:hypothetical protein [Streptomyces hydrogenans]|uniref:Uncharacterized protein n=1 Tax=Streptomyces hydrogenans TaxID=1873719 RepID=A0ABQ3PJH8_9ACTN|nr:hypothetical protein [Streptomyces hydrogenans]GHG10309.1 hypothetical protein GCM10018784_23820 [Streptomyces hydrogenans]GHI25167.1 hypothetical protein Shyd_65380 [Streptomyces hydrogenans]
MTDQSGYGTAGQQQGVKLVPNALTAYRHFSMTSELGGLPALVPMSPHTRAAQQVYHVPWRERSNGQPKTFHAGCVYEDKDSGYPHRRHPDSPTPQRDCTCGFYAHYFDETDFYRSGRWFPMGSEMHPPGNQVLVRAVVELSGRIVMGYLGVRAERLTIKAIAVDWSKASGERRQRTELNSYGRLHVTYGYDPFDMNPDVIHDFEEAASDLAVVYGAKFYQDADKMYADHPQQNLSALGINAMTEEQLRQKRYREWRERMLREQEERRERERRLEFERARMQKARERVYLNGTLLQGVSFVGFTVDEAADVVEQTAGVSLKGLADAYSAPVVEPAAPFERALAAKKERPAPPGTGIDRRKRKL